MHDKKDCRKGSSDLKVPMPMPASLVIGKGICG